MLKQENHFKLMDSVIKNTKDAIMITEAEPQCEPGPRIFFVNPAFTSITGYTPSEVVGRSARMLQDKIGSDLLQII